MLIVKIVIQTNLQTWLCLKTKGKFLHAKFLVKTPFRVFGGHIMCTMRT